MLGGTAEPTMTMIMTHTHDRENRTERKERMVARVRCSWLRGRVFG